MVDIGKTREERVVVTIDQNILYLPMKFSNNNFLMHLNNLDFTTE